MENEHWLVSYSREIITEEFEGKDFYPFVNDPPVDALLNDLDRYPHAFVLACCMDRQVNSDKAWSVPFRVQKAAQQLSKEFTVEELCSIPLEWYKEVFSAQSLHRYTDKMAEVFYLAVHRIQDQYDGDASRIWANCPSSAAVVYRFLQFDGVGVKIATMAANTLYRQFHVPFSDTRSIDVSPDVHVIRIFQRTGLVDIGASKEEIIYRARDISPDYPGIVDAACWRLGRTTCHAGTPDCRTCKACDRCPKVLVD